jgi:hypothetical protein
MIIEMRIEIPLGIPALCARCASLGATALLAALLVTPACSSSSQGSAAGSGGSGGSGGAGSGLCSDTATCCTFACYNTACPVTDAGGTGRPCFCNGDYQSPGPDCDPRALDLYKCMLAHTTDGYACNAPTGTAFRCNTFCQLQLAAANAACGRELVQCAP